MKITKYLLSEPLEGESYNNGWLLRIAELGPHRRYLRVGIFHHLLAPVPTDPSAIQGVIWSPAHIRAAWPEQTVTVLKEPSQEHITH